jgi:hypothetical protein
VNAKKTSHWIALLANLGVVAGVVFLAFEIQQNNELLEQDSRYSMLVNQKDWKFFLNGNPEVAKLMYGSQTGELNEIEKLRRFDLVSGLLLTWQWEWEQSQSGLFGDSQLPVEGFRTLWNSLNVQTEWIKLKPILKPEFAYFLEKEVVALVRRDIK